MSAVTFALSASEPRSLSLLRTSPRFTPTALRIGLGVVMLPHGAQKLLGWFGGFGFTNTLRYFTDTLGVSAPLAVLVILAESIGALALVLGLATRVAAAGIAMVMVGAVAMVHLPHGFFMNWAGNQAGEGIEYALLALTMAITLVVVGGGRLSIDAWIEQNASRSEGPPQSWLRHSASDDERPALVIGERG